MVYTAEEYRKLADMMEAFCEYVNDAYTFEIVYSSKMGYLWLDVAPFEAGYYRLTSAQALFENLCWCIYCDVIRSTKGSEYVEWETRKRIKRYMKHLPDQKQYEPALEAFLAEPSLIKSIPYRKRLTLR